MTPKVDTFEGDISEEIKRKEASLAEISAASNDVRNNEEVVLPKKTPIFFTALVTLIIFSLIGFGVLGYYYYTTTTFISAAPIVEAQPAAVLNMTTELGKLSPALSEGIGRFVTKIEKKEQGYIITFNAYSPVFAYVTRNENEYIQELALLFAEKPAALNTTNKIQTPPPAITSTSTATSTATVSSSSTSQQINKAAPKKAATSTVDVSVPVALQETPTALLNNAEPSLFSDVTVENQNMRIWTLSSRSVVYAFVGSNSLVISNTQEGVLIMKNAILK